MWKRSVRLRLQINRSVNSSANSLTCAPAPSSVTWACAGQSIKRPPPMVTLDATISNSPGNEQLKLKLCRALQGCNEKEQVTEPHPVKLPGKESPRVAWKTDTLRKEVSVLFWTGCVHSCRSEDSSSKNEQNALPQPYHVSRMQDNRTAFHWMAIDKRPTAQISEIVTIF